MSGPDPQVYRARVMIDVLNAVVETGATEGAAESVGASETSHGTVAKK